MNKFIIKALSLIVLFIVVVMILIFAMPKDNNSYFSEYRCKIHLLESVAQPRVIIIGGSGVAFGTDSKRIKDSLNINVVNFGLHAGLGIRYPLEDCLEYIKKGDIVAIQMEYENYFSGGNGGPEAFLPFMISTGWRKTHNLNIYQWENIFLGIKDVCKANLTRLAFFLITKSFDKKPSGMTFEYAKSGFNEYGDEVSHLKYPSKHIEIPQKAGGKSINESFIMWLSQVIDKYEHAGAKVYMMPPPCSMSQFKASYDKNISKALDKIHHPFIVEPASNAFDDSCSFDTGYHMNKVGVCLNTNNIIKALRNKM